MNFAQSISKTTFFQNIRPVSTISEFELEIRSALDELIAYIKDYFIDIDVKMKALCQNIDSVYGGVEKHELNPETFPQQRKETLQGLSSKIANLEVSLKNTQENQRKLVEIIERIC